MAANLTAEQLRQMLDYDPDTGVFRWRIRPSQSTKLGQIAGCLDAAGYVSISIKDRRYLGHRLAWLHVHGVWPKAIDHRDLNRANNAISNLREATQRLNRANSPVSTHNRLGVKGVRRVGNRFRVMADKRHVGYFDTVEEASEAYLKAAQGAFGDFARVL